LNFEFFKEGSTAKKIDSRQKASSKDFNGFSY